MRGQNRTIYKSRQNNIHSLTPKSHNRVIKNSNLLLTATKSCAFRPCFRQRQERPFYSAYQQGVVPPRSHPLLTPRIIFLAFTTGKHHTFFFPDTGRGTANFAGFGWRGGSGVYKRPFFCFRVPRSGPLNDTPAQIRVV